MIQHQDLIAYWKKKQNADKKNIKVSPKIDPESCQPQ